MIDEAGRFLAATFGEEPQAHRHVVQVVRASVPALHRPIAVTPTRPARDNQSRERRHYAQTSQIYSLLHGGQ